MRRKAQRGHIKVLGARENNLQGIDAKFPIGLLYQAAAMDYDTAYDQVIEKAGGAAK